MAANPIAQTYARYKHIAPNPIAQSALLAAVLIPMAYAVKKPFYNQLKDLAADPRVAALLGVTPEDAVRSVEEVQEGFMGKHVLPFTLGSAVPVLALAANAHPKAKYYGLTSWEPYISPQHKMGIKDAIQTGVTKTASLFQMDGYQPQIDMSQQLNRYDAVSLLQNNPILKQSPYAVNLGTSIVTAAPYTGAYTTLGGVYDSAVNKFQKKLQYQGLGSKMLKGALSGSLAGMFTDIVGTVIGVPQPLRRSLANSAGIGTALYQVLT